tara:strand:+ start:463 stop:1305 length:843 start_codon:yes stop_codon:yes gene_type:complete
MRIYFRILLYVILILSLNFCTKKNEKKIDLTEKSQELQMIEAYNQGITELEKGDIIYAAKKFNEAEIIYPQSVWAPRASLMAAYAYFSQAYYEDAILELNRFIKKYNKNPNIGYAYYLLALCHYDQIVDETKDTQRIFEAEKNFKIVTTNYQDTEYAIDSAYKLDYIQEILASKEMYVARYYVQREKWIPAINRFKTVVEIYENTIFIEEALHRLVELNYKIGLEDEAKKYATVLGYNYQSSEWYDQTYKIFNKNYKKISKKQTANKKNKFIQKFKELLK